MTKKLYGNTEGNELLMKMEPGHTAYQVVCACVCVSSEGRELEAIKPRENRQCTPHTSADGEFKWPSPAMATDVDVEESRLPREKA